MTDVDGIADPSAVLRQRSLEEAFEERQLTDSPDGSDRAETEPELLRREMIHLCERHRRLGQEPPDPGSLVRLMVGPAAHIQSQDDQPEAEQRFQCGQTDQSAALSDLAMAVLVQIIIVLLLRHALPFFTLLLPQALEHMDFRQEQASQELKPGPLATAQAVAHQSQNRHLPDAQLGAGQHEDDHEQQDRVGKFDRDRPEVDVIAGHHVLVPGPRPGDLREDDALPGHQLLGPRVAWFAARVEVQLLQTHDHEGRGHAGAKKSKRSAEGGRGKSRVALVEVAGVDGLDGFIGQNETGDDEEDVHHGAAREDDAEERQLDPSVSGRFRVVLFSDAVGAG